MLEPALERYHPNAWDKANRECQELSKSLWIYVTADDIVLSRQAFLRAVMHRIADDIDASRRAR